MLDKMRELDSEEEIRKCFRVFDHDGNGFISADELKYMMGFTGLPIGEEEVDGILKSLDRNGDGKLNYEGIIHTALHLLINMFSQCNQTIIICEC